MSPPLPVRHKRWHTVATLGTAQTLAWASSYYLPAMLAAPMARDLGVSTPTVFAAFSLALVISALVGPVSGRTIDRHGGRPVLMATNLVFAAGLVSLGLAQGPASMCAAWALIGLAMGCGLYESAFAALVRLYGHESRNPITGITLIAGFASTVGWPLSALHVFSESHSCFDLHAHILDDLDFPGDHISWETILRNADRHHAACHGQFFKNSHPVPFSSQVIGSCQAGRP